MREKHIERVPVRGGELTVARWPGDGPCVLAVHGITASHMAWPAVVDEWPRHYDVVAPDLRGRGSSSALPAPFGIGAHVADLLAVLDHRAWRSAVVVGHSLGAYIGVQLAVSAPERARGLVLIDGGIAVPLPQDRTPDQVLETTLGPAIERLGQTFGDREHYRDFWRGHPALTDEGAWNPYVEAYVDYDLGGEPPHLKSRVNPDAVWADGRDPLAPAMVTLIDRVAAPILLLTAPRGLLNQPKPFLSRSAVAAKDAALANLSCSEIEDTNHYTILMGSGRQRTGHEIARFIEALEEA